MRKNFGKKSWLYPQPVLILAAYDEAGVPCAMNAAWGGISDTNQISICLSSFHKTVKNLRAAGVFTVSPATKREVAAADYVGLASGNDVANKIEKAGWHARKAEKVNAPVFDELPMSLECKLIDYDENTGILRGEIVNVSADESVLSDGKIDPRKLEPICFDPIHNTYNVIGEVIGQAFAEGKKLF